jgi:hypothetical protein
MFFIQTNSLSRSSLAALARHTSGPKSPYYKAHNFTVSQSTSPANAFNFALVKLAYMCVCVCVFQVHTYIAPTWCEVCHHFLWGLKHQGMRCKDCGMDIHKQCLPLTIQLECYPNKQCVKRGKVHTYTLEAATYKPYGRAAITRVRILGY